MLEPLTINLVAGGVSSIGSVSIKKVQDILRRKRFSEDIDDLTTEFATALKEALVDELERDIEANWATIAEELDELEVVFKDEQEAVVQITRAIGEGLEIELETNPQLREAIETAVADAYQTALREFADRVAGTDLADVFDTETNVELTATVNELDDRLITIQRQLRRQRTAALRNAGVIWLDPLYFERQEPGDPEAAWRTGFDFAEVEAGYPLSRERPPQHDAGERRALTDEIIDRLNDGEDLVVLGDGGSGKSTICKQVACQWRADNRGPVFYRTSNARTSFNEPGPLIEAIRAADEEALVVVEDAATESTAPLYEVLDEFESTSNVSVLFDSRETAWRNNDELAGAPQLKRYRQLLSVVEMPALDPTECQRAVEHYEALTGDEIERSGEQLHDHIRNADIGGSLVLAYELTGPSGETGDKRTVSALHDDVHRAYLSVDRWANSDFPKTVAVMMNVLNAANLPVTEAFVHALADDRDDHKTIERTLGFLEGTVFSSTGGNIQTPHQMWSALYLEQLLDADGERMACYHFEECTDALFRLCEVEDRRAQVTDWLREEPEVFISITATPTKESDRFIRQIAKLGQSRPSLGVLYGTPETWQVPLPEPCSLNAELIWYNCRGKTHLNRGTFEEAVAEWEHLLNMISAGNEEAVNDDKSWQSITLTNLGLVARERGDLDTAEEYLKQSLEIDREIRDSHGEAKSLDSLGLVAESRGDLNSAEEYHKQSLAIFREVGDRHSEAKSLNNLGVILKIRGDLAAAEVHYRQSIKIDREVGDRHGEAKSLGNLGVVARKRGDLDAAEKYHEQSLSIHCEVGDRHGEAKSLGNLGLVAKKRGDLNTAKECYRQSLAIFEEIEDRRSEAKSLGNLGEIARKCGDLDTAEEYNRQSLEIKRKVGDRHGEAVSLGNLGLVAHMHGDHDTAENYYQEAFEISLDVEATLTAFSLLGDIVDVCEELDASETALNWCNRAIEIAEQVGNDEASERFQERRAEFK